MRSLPAWRRPARAPNGGVEKRFTRVHSFSSGNSQVFWLCGAKEARGGSILSFPKPRKTGPEKGLVREPLGVEHRLSGGGSDGEEAELEEKADRVHLPELPSHGVRAANEKGVANTTVPRLRAAHDLGMGNLSPATAQDGPGGAAGTAVGGNYTGFGAGLRAAAPDAPPSTAAPQVRAELVSYPPSSFLAVLDPAAASSLVSLLRKSLSRLLWVAAVTSTMTILEARPPSWARIAFSCRS